MERILGDDPVLPLPNGAVVAVGAFDGVHRGHQAVLAELRRGADAEGASAVVVLRVAAGRARVLTPFAQRLELLERHGVDVADARPHASVDPWHPRAVVRGVPTVVDDVLGVRVSTAAICAALARGDVGTAARLLGRDPELRGVVEPGDGRGRELGFPTANVAVPEEVQLPADGVYAGWYERPDGRVHASAISIGRRPTFYADAGLLLVEAYLLDFDGDLYGERARVRVARRLRAQERFGSVAELVAQLRRDVDDVRRALR